jgi:hypothetical protein
MRDQLRCTVFIPDYDWFNPLGRAHAMALHAAAYAQLGRMDEARTAREAHLKLSPNYSIKLARRTLKAWPPENRKHAKGGLRKLGFSENLPLKLPTR